MKYKNTKTQAVIETACVVSGGNWVPIDGKKTKDKKKENPEKKQQKEDD